MIVGFKSAKKVHAARSTLGGSFAVFLVSVEFGIKHSRAVPSVVRNGTVVAHAEHFDAVFFRFIDIILHFTDGMSAVFAMCMKIHFVLRKNFHVPLRILR